MRFILILFMAQIFMSEANALCTTSNNVRLRSGPGTKYPVTWTVSRFTPLAEVKRVGSWIQVEDMDGDLHWVYGGSVTTKIICVSVRTNLAKVRKSPSEQGELADIVQVGRYTSFKRVDAQGEWYQVEASWGDSYWINERSVWRPMHTQHFNFK